MTRIEVYGSVEKIYADAFKDYGHIATAAFAKYNAADDDAYGATYSEMGLAGIPIEVLA